MTRLPLLIVLLIAPVSWAGDAIDLYTTPPDTGAWQGDARSFYSEIFRTEVVTNVSIPTLTPFLPAGGYDDGGARGFILGW